MQYINMNNINMDSKNVDNRSMDNRNINNRNVKYVEIGDNNYPKKLSSIKNQPLKLYFEGDSSILNMPSITVVGSRNMTEYGKEMTKKVVKELVQAGMCIISGLAVGIDTIAHQTCLENNGKTVAVLGSGLNKIFPPENMNLYKNIVKKGGCVISEYEPDTMAQKRYFPERNRIVSGLSLGTLVIEATYRSGTAITAKYAFEQGKKVFCLPNCVGTKNSAGTINLLKSGAILVTNAKEILYELGIINEKKNFEKYLEKQKENKIIMLEQEQLTELDRNTKKIYFYIRENKIVTPELMCEILKMPITEINMHLTILELKGLVINKYGDKYMLRDDLYV